MTRIVFRLNYHTVEGQSLWVRIIIGADGNEFVQTLPLRWINDRQWQTEWELGKGSGIR
mgnify:FL=1